MGEFKSKFNIRAVANTTIGGRPENQDDFCVLDTPLGCLAVVCDGMGGGPGGRTASFIAKNVVREVVCSAPATTKREVALQNAIQTAQMQLDRQANENPALKGMGTTIVAALINQDSAVIVHLGDSRCYRLRGQTLMYKSQDHSLVAELVKRKTLSEEEARVSSHSNIITRGLGSVKNHVPEIDVVPFCKGDRFFICTDGVWGMFKHDDLINRFTAQTDIMQIMMNLQQEVDRMGYAAGGNHDNHSLVILETGMNSKLKDSIDKRAAFLIAGLSVLLLVSFIFNVVAGFSHRNAERLKDEEIERLTAYEHRYKDLIDDDGAKYSQILNILIVENDSLRSLVAKQQQQIDSMLRTLALANDKKELQPGKKVSLQENPVAKDDKNDNAFYLSLVKAIVKKLENLREINYKEFKEANTMKKSSLSKIVTDVDRLDKETKGKYKRKINQVKSLLGNTNFQTTKRLKSGYGYDDSTKKKVTDIINVINDIK